MKLMDTTNKFSHSEINNAAWKALPVNCVKFCVGKFLKKENKGPFALIKGWEIFIACEEEFGQAEPNAEF